MRKDDDSRGKRTVGAKKATAKPRDRNVEGLIARYYDEVSEEICSEERAWGEFSLTRFLTDN